MHARASSDPDRAVVSARAGGPVALRPRGQHAAHEPMRSYWRLSGSRRAQSWPSVEDDIEPVLEPDRGRPLMAASALEPDRGRAVPGATSVPVDGDVDRVDVSPLDGLGPLRARLRRRVACRCSWALTPSARLCRRLGWTDGARAGKESAGVLDRVATLETAPQAFARSWGCVRSRRRRRRRRRGAQCASLQWRLSPGSTGPAN